MPSPRPSPQCLDTPRKASALLGIFAAWDKRYDAARNHRCPVVLAVISLVLRRYAWADVERRLELRAVAGLAAGQIEVEGGCRPRSVLGRLGPIAADEAGPDLRHQHFVTARAGAWRADRPSMEPAARNTERLTKPPHRPDPSMPRNEAELHIDSLTNTTDHIVPRADGGRMARRIGRHAPIRAIRRRLIGSSGRSRRKGCCARRRS
jgi:hypothetical protein